ncbi:DUF2971 domain-containing protein [Oceanobacter kriegii]|uniref:DUF2971 domain-containing protein n=1 Tax=Oceanobacter kriegii TaxID=64972 RepID=UPI000481954C|nr:DUF2971 domain-containing protein [Oceanobacter kriegii]
MSEIIRRYMSFDKFASLMLGGNLFLPKMTLFSDDLEGGLPAHYFISMSNDAPIIDLAVNGAMGPIGESQAVWHARLAENEKHRKAIEAREFLTPFGAYPSSGIEAVHPQCREWIYVSCWNRSEMESVAMWQIYGGSRNSLCLVSDKESVLKSIESPGHMSVEFYDVEYIDHDEYAESCQSGNGFTPFKLKSQEYEFENETRLICFDPSVDLTKSDKNPENGMVL